MQAGWLAEFRRRNVHRVLIAYLAVAWLLAQVAEFLSDAFAWPAWILRALVVVLLLGLPAAVAVAWFFEWTPAGLVREEPAPRDAALRLRPHRGFDLAIAALLAVALGYFAATHEWRDEEPRPPPAGRATLAVLPFKPVAATDRDEALEFGMADTLILRLSGIAGMAVSPLSSVRRYSALDSDALAAGRELGVRSVLDGNVQRSGERLRVTARVWRGFWLGFVGRTEEGLAELATAVELEPSSMPQVVTYARGLYSARRHGEAAAALERVVEVEPQNMLARALLASVYIELGRFDAAPVLASDVAGKSPSGFSVAAVALARAGRSDEARAALNRLVELAQHRYVPAYDIASVHAALGDADQAFQWLDRAFAEPSALLANLRADPVMDPLRSDSRYREIERRLRLPER